MANKALLIGINNYQHINDLRGCHNDVTNMRHILLTYFDFPADNISVLLDHRAVRGRIEQRWQWLLDGAKAGDQLVFHFSGHGSYMRDMDGDEAKRKLKDHTDELLCLYDMDWDNPNSYLLDDTLDQWTRQLPKGVNLTVILDSCHSGDGTRPVVPPSHLAPPTDTSGAYRASRFVEPPLDIRLRVDERADFPAKRFPRSTSSRKLNHVLLAGCRDDQTSADAYLGGAYNGAFTYYLCKTIRDQGSDLTYKQLMASVSHSLRHNAFTQNPQLQGAKNNQKLFR